MNITKSQDILPSTASRASSRQLFTAIFALILAVGLTVVTLNRYIKDADEAYQIMNALDWQNVPFASLSAYIGHLWGCLWDFSWLSMRVLSLILNLLSIGIGGAYVYRTFGNAPRAIWLTTAAIVLYAFTNDHEQKYDWDTFASFTLTLTAVIAMCYIARPRTRLIIFAGIAAGVTVMMRLPSVPVVVVPFVAILLSQAQSKIKQIGIYILSLALTLWGLVCTLFGSPEGMLNTIHDNAIGAHSAGLIMKITLYSARFVAMYIAVFAIAFFVVKKCMGLWRGKRIAVEAVVLVFIILATFFLSRYTLLYEYPYTGLISFTFISGVVFGRKQWRSGMSADMIVMALCGLAAVAGSNCGFNRMIVYPFIPIVWVYIIKEWPGWARRAEAVCFVGSTVVMLSLSASNFRVFIDGFDRAKYSGYDNVKARGVYFDRCDVEWFEEVVPIIESYKHRPDCAPVVLSEYLDGYLIEYLTDTPNPVTRHDWGYKTLRPDVPVTVEKVIEQVRTAPGCGTLILVLSPPFNKTSPRTVTAFDTVFTRVSTSPHCIVYQDTKQP